MDLVLNMYMKKVGSFLNFIQHIQRCQDEGLVGLHDLSVHDHLVEDVVGLLNIVHDIQLADVLEVLVHGLHQVVNELQVGHLVLSH